MRTINYDYSLMESLLAKIKGLNVLVIGDVMLDHYIWGDADRISPEAPVPVIDVSKDTYVPGGAANVALNVKELGGKVTLCGNIANDDAGEQLMLQFNKRGILYDPRFARNNAPTILKTRVVVRGQQMCRLDREETPTHYGFNTDEQWTVLEQKVKESNLVIFSDYAKGVITQDLIDRVKEVAQKTGTFLAIDPKPKSRLSFQGLDLMTPNKKEAIVMSRLEVDAHEDFPFREISIALWERYRCNNTVVTMGAQGMMLSCGGVLKKLIPTVAREVYDVSGAGDTVIATMAMAMASGGTLEEAATLANVAAGVVVSKLGTALVSPEEVLAYIAEDVEGKRGVGYEACAIS